MTGTCNKCEKPIEYRQITQSVSVWVHVDTGKFRSSDPSPHDCNTSFRKDKDQ